MKATPVKASKDKRVFRKTYNKTKKVNKSSAYQQGGLRF